MELDRRIRRSEVEKLTGLSTASIYRKMRDGSFPRPLKVGVRAVRWSLSEIQAWLSNCPHAEGIRPQKRRTAA